MSPDVSLVLLNWNTRELLDRALAAALKSARGLQAETIVVDNGSIDGSPGMVRGRYPKVSLVRLDRNTGPAHGFNEGLRRATGRVVVLVNTDAFLTRKALHGLVAFLDGDATYGAAVPRLLNRDGSTQRGVMRFPTRATLLCHDSLVSRLWPGNPASRRYFMRDWDQKDSRDVDQPPQAVFAIRRSALEGVGLLDELMPIYFNDVDWCLRLRRAGWRIRYLADLPVTHLGGATAGKLTDRSVHIFRDRVRYARKHFGPSGAWLAKVALYSLAGSEALSCLVNFRASWERRRIEAARVLRLARDIRETA